MKFLCDRCKTRYSIGDDRVRGKILKIRCKNCANVITVREGMSDVDAVDDEPVPLVAREKRTTTMAPAEVRSTPASPPSPPASTLGAAFATAMAAKPPAALEEEWYVSIEGEQQGPYSLADAQKWVSDQPAGADLHCWSEGFDDWLPVDKVSHFRGMRKKAPPVAPRAAPPPPAARGTRQTMQSEAQARFGRPGGPAGEGATAVDDPKPLFAATMASLESGPAALPALPTPLPAPLPTPPVPTLSALAPNVPPKATPPKGVAAVPRVNGAVVTPIAAAASKSSPVRAETVPGVGAGGASTLASAWDASERDALDTQPPPVAGFAFDLASRVDPAAAATVRDVPVAVSAASAAVPGASDDDDDDGDLAIGEVSRVVNLADLVRRAPQPRVAAPVARAATTGAGGVGALAGLRATASVAKFDPDDLAQPATAPLVGDLTPAPAAIATPAATPVATKRRTLIILLGVGAAVLAGLVVLVVMLIGKQDDDDLGGDNLGRVGQVDTERPDDPIHHGLPSTLGSAGSAGSGSAAVGSAGSALVPIPHHVIPTHPQLGSGGAPTGSGGSDGKQEIDLTKPGAVTALKPEEVEDMSTKQGMGSQRCYEQALKKDPFLDVKRITVTIIIDAAGAVTDVKLSDHDADMLGKCLSARIRGWKFRASTAGITAKITMVFQQG